MPSPLDIAWVSLRKGVFSRLDAAISGHDGGDGGIDSGIKYLMEERGMSEEAARTLIMDEMRKPKEFQEEEGDEGLPDTKDTSD